MSMGSHRHVMLQKASGYDPLGSRDKSSHFTDTEKHLKWRVECTVYCYNWVEIVDQSTGDLVYIDRNSTPINLHKQDIYLFINAVNKCSSVHLIKSR